ncbi:hypothetical protein MN116_009063 [Schistosoma mekongi]|uniref:Homeobox domain-containing protein n=1 Tax=Schistosoma mekongi TaxID=38744 RepID=A0AAE1Z4I4_SCHME|nr:hypothetical protein MN116_009063 [Schistosoma mekongi]
MNNLLIENLESWEHLQKNTLSSNIDPHLLTFYGGSCCPVELKHSNRRKNATRETTSMLKAWLNEHRKNPYPTKGEKIMLALITKMSLTQVSTWFANARRRLKKENKVTWNLHNYDKFTLCKLFNKHKTIETMIDNNNNINKLNINSSTSRIRTLSHSYNSIESIPKKRPNLDYENSKLTINSIENDYCINKLKPCKIWSLVDIMNEQNNTQNIQHELLLLNEKNSINLHNTPYDNWSLIENRKLQSSKNLLKTSNESSSYQIKMNNITPKLLDMHNNDHINENNINHKLKEDLSTFSSLPIINNTTSSSISCNNDTINNNIHIQSNASSLLSPDTLTALYLYYQQNLQRAQEQNHSTTLSSLSYQFPMMGQQPPSPLQQQQQ